MQFDKQRLENALWGAFIADAMAMPVHWYYKKEYIKEGFEGGISKYEDAPHPHPESFMVGSGYFPDIKKAEELGRKFDILHKHSKFYQTNYTQSNFHLSVHEGEHKNAMPELNERYHYHHKLKKGENTIGAHLLRVLMRSIIKEKSYNQNSFIEDFINYFTTPHLNKDPYLEIYIREWFQNYSKGLPIESCAQEQRNVWSIGSNGGVIRPLLLSLISSSSYQALGVAISHQQLTHRSENISSALSVLVPLLHDLLHKAEPMSTLKSYAKKVQLIKIKGSELTKRYAEHNGPWSIPKNEMWKIHTEFSNKHLDLEYLLKNYNEDEIIGTVFTTACYPEHFVPVLMYLLYKNSFDFKVSILANANGGGDSVHRGIILGMLAGAANDKIPQELKEGLKEYENIKKEIKDFIHQIFLNTVQE